MLDPIAHGDVHTRLHERVVASENRDLAYGRRPLDLLLGLAGFLVMALAVQYGVTHMPLHRSAVILLFELVVGAVSALLLIDAPAFSEANQAFLERRMRERSAAGGCAGADPPGRLLLTGRDGSRLTIRVSFPLPGPPDRTEGTRKRRTEARLSLLGC